MKCIFCSMPLLQQREEQYYCCNCKRVFTESYITDYWGGLSKQKNNTKLNHKQPKITQGQGVCIKCEGCSCNEWGDCHPVEG